MHTKRWNFFLQTIRIIFLISALNTSVNVLGLYYTTLPGNKIYKIEYPKLIECSTKDIDEANRRTQLAGALDGLATVLASDRCVIFFNDLTKTSIMCADSSKEINSNKVR